MDERWRKMEVKVMIFSRPRLEFHFGALLPDYFAQTPSL